MNYKVYQGTELKQTATSKTAVMNGLQPNKTYDFSVQPDDDNVQTVGGKTRYTHVAYANMKYIALENSSFTLSERSTVRFGADNQWVYKTFDAGNYTASNSTFGGDPYQGMAKHAEVISDFSVDQSENKTYIGFYTDFTQTDSTDPRQYVWNLNASTSVTTRGIRFNIPKTLTVGSTITLRYEEYPLGIVPIGNEPSGMFGGGNKQSLSAKVISTANGRSVVEVAGNVIDVGGRNLLQGTSGELSGKSYGFAGYQISGGLLPGTTYTLSGWARVDQTAINHKQFVFVCAYTNDWSWSNQLTISGSLTSQYNKITFTTPSGKEFNPSADVYLSHPDGGSNESNNDSISGMGYISKFKLEPGTIATPYASFVDGDTFTAQPDGTFALFSEHKALYY